VVTKGDRKIGTLCPQNPLKWKKNARCSDASQKGTVAVTRDYEKKEEKLDEGTKFTLLQRDTKGRGGNRPAEPIRAAQRPK